MPFRRRFRSRTSGAVKPPKPPKATKQPKPEFKALLGAYKKYSSGSITIRLQALYEVVGWWDGAVPYYLSKKPVNAAQLKTYETANKARALGFQGTTPGEQETGLLTAIRLYEKIWATDHKVPAFGPYADKYRANQAKHEARERVLQNRFADVLQALNSAFTPLGLDFTVQKSDVARQFDGNHTILLNEELCKVLAERSKKEGLLSVLFSETVVVLKATSIEADDQGRHTLNVQKILSNVPNALSGILKYCDSVPRSKVFKAAPETVEAVVGEVTAKKQRAVKQRDPNAPKRTIQRGATEKVGGRYVPGSAMAVLYERLCNQTPQALSDALAGIPVANPLDRLNWLRKHGEATGQWKVSISGNVVQMILNQ